MDERKHKMKRNIRRMRDEEDLLSFAVFSFPNLHQKKIKHLFFVL